MRNQEDNLLAAAWKKRCESLSPEIRQRLDDLSRYFDYVGGATMDGRISRKADVIAHLLDEIGEVDRDKILMIGDRENDIEGAKENGLKSLGVLWGYGSYEELNSAGADYLAGDPSDIPVLCCD